MECKDCIKLAAAYEVTLIDKERDITTLLQANSRLRFKLERKEETHDSTKV